MWVVYKWFSVTLRNAVKVVFSQANPCSLLRFCARKHSDSWNSGWPAAPTVMRTWQVPKPQHSTPRRSPDQGLRKVFIIWLALIFQRVLWSIFILIGQLTPKENTEFPSINSQHKCLLAVQIITSYLLQTLHKRIKLCKKKKKKLSFIPIQLCRLCHVDGDYRDAGSLLCVRLISIPVTLRWEG